MQIYFPQDLYDRIKAQDAHHRLNVSLICQEAIEKALNGVRSKPAVQAARKVTRTPRSKPGHLSDMERLQDIMTRGGFQTRKGGET